MLPPDEPDAAESLPSLPPSLDSLALGWEQVRDRQTTAVLPSFPESVLAESAKSEETVGGESDESSGDQKPRVIVVTEPTELIVLDGKAQYSPISGAELLYVSNTDRDIFMDIDSQRHYILLSGRWYTSKSLDGKKWKYVASDKLPGGFAKIPGGSAKENPQR